MTIVAALAVTATVLVGFNLVLTYGLIRRLRVHSQLLSSLSAPDTALPVGAKVGPFTAVTTTGRTLSSDDLPERVLIGFFSPSCPPCLTELPRFVDHVRRTGTPALAVVLGEEQEIQEMAETLEPVAWVAVEPHGGPISTAFRVTGTPTVLLIEDGTVAETGLPEIAAKHAA
ncbi:TlpA disulfide reductase family protein [Thermopolyspora sp. NPDC052614]|uniref:peroxiredoxin family protein n=1 Tax=Thermopolyspora sp. NPDC052614 TaxID=3155682 RepID=UPI00343273DD